MNQYYEIFIQKKGKWNIYFFFFSVNSVISGQAPKRIGYMRCPNPILT